MNVAWRPNLASGFSRTFEDIIAALAMLAMVALPLLEIAVRRLFGVGVPASGPIVQHLTLWVGFLGAAIAARDGKLLALATGTFIPEGRSGARRRSRRCGRRRARR